MTAGMMSPWLHSTVWSGSDASSSTTGPAGVALGQHLRRLRRAGRAWWPAAPPSPRSGRTGWTGCGGTGHSASAPLDALGLLPAALRERPGLHPGRPTRSDCPPWRAGRGTAASRERSLGAMSVVPLREVCGVRSGDKGDISDLTLFADDARDLRPALARRSRSIGCGPTSARSCTGPIERYEAAQRARPEVRAPGCARRRRAPVAAQRQPGQDAGGGAAAAADRRAGRGPGPVGPAGTAGARWCSPSGALRFAPSSSARPCTRRGGLPTVVAMRLRRTAAGGIAVLLVLAGCSSSGGGEARSSLPASTTTSGLATTTTTSAVATTTTVVATTTTEVAPATTTTTVVADATAADPKVLAQQLQAVLDRYEVLIMRSRSDPNLPVHRSAAHR